MSSSKPETSAESSSSAAAPSPGALLLVLWRACRPWAGRVVVVFAFAVMALVLLIKYRAESNLLSVFLAYLPGWILSLPLAGAALVGIFFACWRAAGLALLLAVAVVVCLGGERLFSSGLPSEEAGGAVLSVMTYNRGQGGTDVLATSVADMRPDIVAFQDAGRRLPQLAVQPQFAAHRFGHQSGEFVTLSRWPVIENEAVTLAWGEKNQKDLTVALRSVVDWNGRRIVVYNVHFPTPRDLLYWYAQRGTFLYGVLGIIPGTFLYDRHQHYLETWRARVRLASQLAARVRLESDPVILMGDLNLPPLGKAYHLLCADLLDAHAAAGTGFGSTFPGDMRSAARLFAPWLRIDHVLASRHWEVRQCKVAATGRSQHLPVGAKFILR